MKSIFCAIIIALSAVTATAQINYRDCDQPVAYNVVYKKADCSIAGNSKETVIYVIQIGAYRNPITPRPNTICIPYAGLYRYYLSTLYLNYTTASAALNKLDKKIYCDAKVVKFPIENIKGYK